MAVPFLLDVEVHVKFLLAMPLLIAAEPVVHRRMRHVVRPIPGTPFDSGECQGAFRCRRRVGIPAANSVFAEVLLIAFVYVVGILIVWRHYTALDAATWYATPSVGGSKLSLAGMWYGYVSLPIFQFLRLFVWTRFFWQVSRIQLSLVPTHPDRTGGLGFVSGTAYAFALLAGAHGALLAGQCANRIFYLGAALPEFKVEIAVMVIFLLCVVIGPLLVFTPQLAEVNWCFFPDQTEAGLSSLEGRVGRLGSCGSFILHRFKW